MDIEELKDLRLRDFVPRPTVRLPQSTVYRASTPAVDAHNHLGRWHDGDWRVKDVPALVGLMDECNVATVVNLDGCWDDELETNLDRYDRAHPDRFVTYCRVDWSQTAVPGWPDRVAASIVDSASRGAKGLKLWKDIGLRLRDENGELLFLDDPRLEGMWSALADTGLPVAVHTADPAAFFEPMDQHNERVEELLRHPDWRFMGPEFPPLPRLLDALESAVAAHPDVTFVGAHVGCYAEDLDWVDRMLTTYPNFAVDIAARIAELGRQPRRTRKLIEDHPDRVVLGTDVSPPTAEDYATYFRFLETADEYFPYDTSEPPGNGRWRISALDLSPELAAAVIGDNARRLIPALHDHSGIA
ncbi:amidohydrolase family protein [Xylanimonas sp. McL0601]|uniref:amidohydrolase family protein n=1 Tax=Xylanimonas sp. McL0601 TaxID=3414739 RepID=UPI003CF50B06